MKKSKTRHFGPEKATGTTHSADKGCMCGCCGPVPEYDEEDFIVEEDEY